MEILNTLAQMAEKVHFDPTVQASLEKIKGVSPSFDFNQAANPNYCHVCAL